MECGEGGTRMKNLITKMVIVGLLIAGSMGASTQTVVAQSCGGGTLTGAQPITVCGGSCSPLEPGCCTESCAGVTLAIEYCSDYTNESSCNGAGFGGSFTCGTGGSCGWGTSGGGGGGGSSCPGECRQGSSCGAGYSGASGCSGSGPGGGCKSNQTCCSANSCGGGGGGSVQCVPPQDCPPGTIKSATVASSVCDPVCGGTGGDCLSNKNACF